MYRIVPIIPRNIDDGGVGVGSNDDDDDDNDGGGVLELPPIGIVGSSFLSSVVGCGR